MAPGRGYCGCICGCDKSTISTSSRPISGRSAAASSRSGREVWVIKSLLAGSTARAGPRAGGFFEAHCNGLGGRVGFFRLGLQRGCDVRCNGLQQRRVYFGVAGQYVAGFVVVIVAAEIADHAARFLEQQDAGRHVPRLQADLPEAVEPAGGDVGEVERRRSGPADAGRLRQQRLEHAEKGDDVRLVFERKTGAEQTALEAAGLAPTDAPPFQLRAAAAGGGEQFGAERIVDHRHFAAALVAQCDRHRKLRKAVQEIGGAVEWVDHPGILAAALFPALFGEDAMIGMRLADGLDDLLFGAVVDLGHEIVAAFALDLQAVHALERAGDDGAGLAGGGPLGACASLARRPRALRAGRAAAPWRPHRTGRWRWCSGANTPVSATRSWTAAIISCTSPPMPRTHRCISRRPCRWRAMNNAWRG